MYNTGNSKLTSVAPDNTCHYETGMLKTVVNTFLWIKYNNVVNYGQFSAKTVLDFAVFLTLKMQTDFLFQRPQFQQ